MVMTVPPLGDETAALASVADAKKIKGKTFEQWAKWEGHGVPTFDNTDPGNPRQAFLPVFTAMPGVKGAPLLVPVEYWETLSWRMWLLGMRPTGGKRHLKYRAPTSVTNAWTSQGEWVDIDAPDPERSTMKDLVDSLPQADQAALRATVLEKIGLEQDSQIPEQISHLRVDELAERLDMTLIGCQTVLRRFGIRQVEASDLVTLNVGERIAAHLGL